MPAAARDGGIGVGGVEPGTWSPSHTPSESFAEASIHQSAGAAGKEQRVVTGL